MVVNIYTKIVNKFNDSYLDSHLEAQTNKLSLFIRS